MSETFPQATPLVPSTPRAPYVAPVLDELGAWSSMTLQQTIPVTPDMTLQEYLIIRSM